MVHEPDEGPLSGALANLVGRAALGAAAVASVVVALALLAELLRRRERALRLIRVFDAALPAGARTAAVSLLAVAATFTAARPAGAEESLRGWLGRPSTSTTRPGPVVTRETVDQLVEPPAPPGPTGPVVLIPPEVETRPDVTPTPPVAPARPAPVAPAVEPPTYEVQPGDCLWSIARAQLGPGADGSAIDAGWRRIYDTNRAAIGDNPSLIHIGLVLRLPPLDART